MYLARWDCNQAPPVCCTQATFGWCAEAVPPSAPPSPTRKYQIKASNEDGLRVTPPLSGVSVQAEKAQVNFPPLIIDSAPCPGS